MRKIPIPDRRSLLQAALGEIEADLAIKNTLYFNLFTGEEYPATVFIHQGFVVHVESENLEEHLDHVKEVVDAEGATIIPGLIDAHMHVESTMLTPRNFAEAVIPHGTTTVVTDPHEVANVAGEEAVKYMHDAGLDLPMRQYINIPSCVPAVPGLEQSGAAFDYTVVDRLAKLENVIGLAEVMDFKGVENGADRMMDMIEAAERNNLYIQGHIVNESGRQLSAYAVGGPTTDHETRSPGEAINKLRVGLYVDARESSMAHNIKTIYNDVKQLPWRSRLALCTDDRESADILEKGHMNDVVRLLIKEGMSPIEAVRAGTLHVAEEIGVTNLGAIAPGYVADFLLVKDFSTFEPEKVFFDGKLVAEKGKMVVEIEKRSFEIEKINTVNILPKQLPDFIMRAPNNQQNGTVKVNVPTYYELNASITNLQVEELPVKNGVIDISHDPDLAYVLTINRYGKKNSTLGLVRNFGGVEGAIGSTVAHDHHNLMIVYRYPEAAYRVYQALQACGGGISCSDEQELLYTLELPVFGLMSAVDCFETAKRATHMKNVLRGIGLDTLNPLLRIVTLGLTVIPEFKYSDLGLVDVMKTKLIPIFPES
ncbi:amidohydrolase family protein [Jeotgalibaca sp. MA1X17-3]|uniref:adenine deaminase n=1 Tax=Jeotgalibaca sp. MA1X17-3 TaxID=2908211 RepID=UPI001F3D8F95|nr:adenine deaminase C-terminal domain-containing protein [Jeotgalibaca sp. MA1X17-3]UJF16468.1 amidohydrolase family protein [Jeotgalibaca sp. MA1X17-3]